MHAGEIRQFCRLQDEGQSLMRAAMTQLNLSARAYHRVYEPPRRRLSYHKQWRNRQRFSLLLLGPPIGLFSFGLSFQCPLFEIGLAKWAKAVASYLTTDESRSGRPQAPRCSTSIAVGRSRDIVDLPDLAGERDDVGGVLDDLDRGRLVQPADDGREGAVPVDPHERAGVQQRRSPLERAVPDALREGEERAPAAELHVDGQPGSGGDFGGGRRLRSEHDYPAFLRLVGEGSGLGDVDRVARDGQPGRDDVAERDQLGNLAIAGDPQHPVVVPVGDEEPAAEGFDRVLEAGGDEEVRRRRIGHGERAEVRDDGKAVRAVHSVDADDIVALEVRADAGDQRVRGPADEGDIDHPAADEEQVRDAGRQPAGEERDGAGLRVDAPDAAGERRGDEQRPAGADGTPLELLQARYQQGRVGLPNWAFRCGCRATAKDDHNT